MTRRKEPTWLLLLKALVRGRSWSQESIADCPTSSTNTSKCHDAALPLVQGGGCLADCSCATRRGGLGICCLAFLIAQACLLLQLRWMLVSAPEGGLSWWQQHRHNWAADEWVPHYRDEPPASLGLGSDKAAWGSTAVVAKEKKLRIAVVTFFLAEPKGGASRYNILPALSHRECYCAMRGYSCHIELLPLSQSLMGTNRAHFNKQLAVRKHLPFYDYVLFADSDVFFHFDRRIESVISDYPDRSIILTSTESQFSMIDAGVFLVRNDPFAYDFLDAWYAYSRHPIEYADSDNGVLHYLLAARLPSYDGSCDKEMGDFTTNRRPCLDPFLSGKDLGPVVLTKKLAVSAQSNLDIARGVLEASEALCMHGHSVGTFFATSRELYNCTAAGEMLVDRVSSSTIDRK